MKLLLLALISVASISAQAQSGLDKHGQDSLKKTQELLRDPNQRQKTLEADPKAKSQDQKIEQSLGGAQNKQRAYEISADIFGDMANESGGDSAKIEQMLQNAQQNPEAFYNSLSDKQKQDIRDLANQISPQSKPLPAGRK